MFDSPGEYGLYCLPVDGAQALLRICNYLRREVTFIGALVSSQTFLGPTEEELVSIREVIDQVETGLMAQCDFSEIVTAIDGISSQLETLADVQETLAAMQACVCDALEWQRIAAYPFPDVGGYADSGQLVYTPEEDNYAEYDDPADNEEKCEFAQAIYYQVFRMYTEYLFPFADQASDVLVAGIVASAAFAVLSGGLGIPLATATSLFAAIVNWVIAGEEENFINWLLNNKDELLCQVFTGLPSLQESAANVRAYIDASGTIGILDKQLLKVTYGNPWWMSWAFKAQQTMGYFDGYFVAGACDDCIPLPGGCISLRPCVPGDWVGGSIVCEGDYPRINGGISYNTAKVLSWPSSPGWFKIRWIPKAEGYPSAQLRFSIRRVSNGAIGGEWLSPLRPIDVPVIETFYVGAVPVGVDYQFRVQQVVYNGLLDYWCASTSA